MIVGGTNKLLLEPYEGKLSPTAEVKSGFATIKQRSQLIGLKLIANAIVVIGSEMHKIASGSTIFFNETDLATAKWVKAKMKSEDISDKEFIIADYSRVVAVKIND